jgi:hypothetical protein
VAATIESTGEIETIIQSDELVSGTTAQLVFRAFEDASPPFTIKVRDPAGKLILDRVIRDLPTGRPQSPPAVTFSIAQPGVYKISIRELYGKMEGLATLTVP